MVPFVFFINLLLWTVVIGFFSVFASHDGLNVLISGSATVFFLESLYRAVHYLPVSVSLGLISVFFFLMRHRTVSWLTAILVLSLLLFCLFFLLPLSYRYTEDNIWSFIHNRSLLTASSNHVLSPGIIRPDDTGVQGVWFSTTDGGKRVAPVVLARPGTTVPVLSVYPEAFPGSAPGSLVAGSDGEIYRATGPDPLFVSVFTPPGAVSFVYTRIATVMDAFIRSFREGFIHYTLFSCIFFVSVTLILTLCHATGWRLLNIFFAVTALMYLYAVYPFFSEGAFFDFVRSLLPSGISPDLLPSLLYLIQAVLYSLVAGFIFLQRIIRHQGQGAPL